MKIIQEALMATMDPGPSKDLKGLKDGDLVDDKAIILADKREINIYGLLNKGPLLLVFIRGTWCPFCRMHLRRLHTWLDSLKKTNGTCIVISSEDTETISKFLKTTPLPYLFASDPKMELSDYFGTHIPPRDYSQAATFLIDVDKSIKLAYKGKRTSKNFKTVENSY